jgi:hypothetical protein
MQSSSFVVLVSLMVATMSTAARSQATDLHPDIATAYAADDVGVIVKATSAAAMVKACPDNVRIATQYSPSLDRVLASNDEIFGPGTTDADIAKKVAEHIVEKDCKILTRALVRGSYKNVFLSAIR